MHLNQPLTPLNTCPLTTGADSVAGTAGDDTINSLSIKADGTAGTTFSAFDAINGGSGTDTLNIYTDNGNTVNNTFPATASVTGVEIVNINNANGGAAFGDASKFSGVQQLWQIGAEVAVTKLAAGATAGFRGATDGTLSVTGATTATSVSVALDKTTDGDVTNGNAVTLNAGGKAVDTVNVAGAIAAGTNLPATQSLTINVTAGVDVQTVALNTAQSATVTVAEDGASTKLVNQLDASGSAGAITFAGDTDVKTIKTGAGKDVVTLDYIATAASQTASVSTGDGNDKITVATNANGKTGFVVSVDAGAGDDLVTLANGLTSLRANDVINGGDGKDTIAVAGYSFVAGDYELISAGLTGFEAVKFTGATAAVVDASRMVGYSDFTFAGNTGDTISKVSATSTLTTANYLKASAAGYVAPTNATTPSQLAGTLNITQVGNDYVHAKAETLNLTVAAQATSDSFAYVYDDTSNNSDVKTATVTVTNKLNTTEDGVYVAYADVEAYKFDSDLTNVTLNNNINMTSVTLAGDGYVYMYNGPDAKLATVDASAMGGTYAEDTVNPWSHGGLSTATSLKGDTTSNLYYYTENSGVKETVTLGSGIDYIYINATANLAGKTLYGSTVLNTDTITGFNLVANAAGTDANYAKSDIIDIWNVSGFAKVTVSGATLGVALNALAATANDEAVFTYGGNTYIYVDGGVVGGSFNAVANDVLDDTDVLVKLTGTLDTTVLAAMLG